jgi:hypothetical protein
MLGRARKNTKRIDSETDLIGFDSLKSADQAFLKRLIAGEALWPPDRTDLGQ